MATVNEGLAKHFQILSEADLDFVIGQRLGWPVGMPRRSPPEFRRRILAAAVSYSLQLSSVDYARKRYVQPGLYEDDEATLGDETSDFLRDCRSRLQKELKELHSPDATFGIFGAEFTLYRVPHALDEARILANRGLLLEVLPILRLCLEMISWAYVAFHMQDENKIVALKAQNCISHLKPVYKTAGKLYGYLSRFSHWGHVIHRQFLRLDEGRVGVLQASVRYRASALALCLIITDVFVEVIRRIYSDRSDALVLSVQGVLGRDAARKTYQYVSRIVDVSGLEELREIEALLQ